MLLKVTDAQDRNIFEKIKFAIGTKLSPNPIPHHSKNKKNNNSVFEQDKPTIIYTLGDIPVWKPSFNYLEVEA